MKSGLQEFDDELAELRDLIAECRVLHAALREIMGICIERADDAAENARPFRNAIPRARTRRMAKMANFFEFY
jgi:hypothetical protein